MRDERKNFQRASAEAIDRCVHVITARLRFRSPSRAASTTPHQVVHATVTRRIRAWRIGLTNIAAEPTKLRARSLDMSRTATAAAAASMARLLWSAQVHHAPNSARDFIRPIATRTTL